MNGILVSDAMISETRLKDADLDALRGHRKIGSHHRDPPSSMNVHDSPYPVGAPIRDALTLHLHSILALVVRSESICF